MITKAYIEEVIDLYHYRVRIPIYHQIKSSSTATPKAMLPIATVCGFAGLYYNFRVGDIVYVGVEDEERNNIVILGSLLYEASNTTPPDMTVSHLTVTKNFELGKSSVSDLSTGGGQSESDESPYIAQDTPPANTKKFWVDTANNNVIKIYINGSWVATSAAWT